METNPELEAQIVEDPEAHAAYLVYGDWLLARDDPRGKLIAAQVAKLVNPSRSAAQAETAVFESEPVLRVPELEDAPAPRVEWHCGFWRSLEVGAFGPPLRYEHVEQLLASDSARFLRRIELWGQVEGLLALVGRCARTITDVSVGASVGDDDLLELRDCARLRKLHLLSDRVTSAGVEVLSLFRELQHVDLGHQLSDASAAHLAGLPLAVLKFRGVHGLTARGMATLAKMPLVTLELAGTSLSDAAIAPLAHHATLAELDAHELPITAAGATTLGSLAQLRRLDLSSSTIDDSGVGALAGLAALETLYVSGTRITDAACETIASLRTLKRLDISRTAIGAAGLRALASLTKLELLDASHLELTDAAIPPLAAFHGLRRLGLAGTSLTDASLDAITALRELDTLDLSFNELTMAGIDRLAQLPKLTDVGLEEVAAAAHACSYRHWRVSRAGFALE